MTQDTLKRIQLFNALLAIVVLIASFYFQYVVGLTPCPLCIMQRICVFLLLGLMILSYKAFRQAHVISFLQIVVVAAGLFFAFRQLWLQSLPPGNVPACMPGLDIMIRYFPWQTVARTLLWGTGDCAQVTWNYWGISLAGWTAMYFAFIGLISCYLFWQTRSIVYKRKNPILG